MCNPGTFTVTLARVSVYCVVLCDGTTPFLVIVVGVLRPIPLLGLRHTRLKDQRAGHQGAVRARMQLELSW